MSKKPVAAGKSSFDLIDTTEFFSRIAVAPNAQILDVACGAGRYSLEMAKLLNKEGLIHAVDLWDEGIESLQKTIGELGIATIRPLLADITKGIPLDEGTIDFCLMATILHDLPPEGQDATLKEINRVLKDDGLLAVIEFKKIDRGPGPPASIRMSEQEAEETIRKYGFRKTYLGEIGEFNYLLTFAKAA
ncbi:class I SAM-dependent methyltransferase [Geotalea sp. SG265]|uniref:class I SAM-dependent methyltransferase n=1 Tax=Geotalea sp. SG265 TaxID=2922867 RepID=UPI001FB01506|nr:class I SAM-dependent methyltransferase [Geotalea sp. SG265]